MSATPVEHLDRLSEAERAVLALLAQGHSIKSAAHALGIGEHAAEERLRSARRKTGATSSRELARALGGIDGPHPRKNRDGLSVLVAGADRAQERPVRNRMRIAPMIVLPLVLAAGAAVLVGQLASPSPPRVVATTPATGETIPAGPFELTVVFDQPMRSGSYSFVATDKGRYPDCATQPRQSRDRRSFTLSCTARSGESYTIAFNGGRFRNFVSAKGGVAAEPYLLRFSTGP